MIKGLYPYQRLSFFPYPQEDFLYTFFRIMHRLAGKREYIPGQPGQVIGEELGVGVPITFCYLL